MSIRTLFVAFLLLASPGAQAAVLISWGAFNSVAVGSTLPSFAARVEDDNFTPVPGLHYVFETDPACGLFGGAASVEGFTDENGVAQAGPFTGTSLTLSCATRVHVEGFAEPLDMSVHVFSPANVVLTANPVEVQAEVGQLYRIHVQMTESGLPVNALPLALEITTSPSGSTGVLEASLSAINSGSAAADIRANDKQGRYDLIVRYSTRQVVIPVIQRVRTGR